MPAQFTLIFRRSAPPAQPQQALIEVGAPTLFATHFMQLTELAALYPAARVGEHCS